MHIFYTPNIENLPSCSLSEEESRHCTKVLRLQAGDVVNLIDGAGGLYEAEIIDSQSKKTQLRILHVVEGFGKRNHYLHIAIAPPKNIERMEWFLEKATEIGIDEVTPILCDRSERKEIKLERLTKVITSAVKQSLKAYLPKLNDLTRFRDVVSKNTDGQKFIAHCAAGGKQELKNLLEHKSNYLILIGPEGDFSPAEIALSNTLGFLPISLGNSRLRTETAALEACFEANFLNRQ